MKWLMKFLLLSIVLFLAACNDHAGKKESADAADSAQTINKGDTTGKGARDTGKPVAFTNILEQRSAEILKVLKSKDYTTLGSYIHPAWKLRFTPYAYIDTINSRLLTASELAELGKSQKKIKWGIYDGNGKPIILSIDQYFDKFVYPKDFLNAEKKSVNKSNGGGNSLDNLREVYPDSDYTEFYFSGFDPKYEGMDWQKLRLVFRKENDQYWLVAIIHDEWTI